MIVQIPLSYFLTLEKKYIDRKIRKEPFIADMIVGLILDAEVIFSQRRIFLNLVLI